MGQNFEINESVVFAKVVEEGERKGEGEGGVEDEVVGEVEEVR